MPIHDWRSFSCRPSYTGPDNVKAACYLRRRIVYALQSPATRRDAPWIIKLEEDKYRQFHLIHPLSESDILTLPETFPQTSFQFTNSSRVKELGKEYILDATDMRMKKVAVLEVKGRDDEFTVLAIDISGKLAMYKSDSRKWVFGNDDDKYDDVILSGNKFYVVNAAGKMDVVVGGDDDGVKVSAVAKPFFGGGGDKKCLVDSDGDLLLVDMIVDDEISHNLRLYDKEYDYLRRTRKIWVFGLDVKTGKWIRLKTLGDKMLFLGDNCKFAASAKDIFGDDYHQGKGDCVVFTDRPSHPYVGIFSLKNKKTIGSIASESYSKTNGYGSMFWPPPRWVNSAASIQELILPSDDESYILSMVDGLTPDQRKILLCCFKGKYSRAQKRVPGLLNDLTEHLAYHHGDLRLAGTIIGMAQKYAGTNNINFLEVEGSICMRWQAGIDHGIAQDISTRLSPITRLLFPKDDDSQLEYLRQDEKPIEPSWYVPIIPTVLVNGIKGIETRGSSFVPNYNPKHIISNVRKLLNHEEMDPMCPWYREFRGKIEFASTNDDGNIYTVTGAINKLDGETVEITELPIGWGFQDYLEFLHSVCAKNRKRKIRKAEDRFIEEFYDYSCGNTVCFLVFLKEETLAAIGEGLAEKFKLITTISTCKMHLRDSEGKLKKYKTPEEILEEFFHYRYNFYNTRTEAMLANLEAELNRCKCKIKIASEILAGNEIDVTDREQYTLTLGREQYTLLLGLIAEDIIPFCKKNCLEEAVAVAGATDDTEETKENTGHLLSHPVQSRGKKLAELHAERNKIEQEIETLRKEKVETLWNKALDDLESKLDEIEDTQEFYYSEVDMGKSMYAKVKVARGAAKKESAAEPMYVSGDTVTEADIVPVVEKAKGRAPAKKKVPAKKAAAAAASVRDNLDSSDRTEDADVAPEQNKKKEHVKRRAAAAKRDRTELSDDEDDIENLSGDESKLLEDNPKKGGTKPAAKKQCPARKTRFSYRLLEKRRLDKVYRELA